MPLPSQIQLSNTFGEWVNTTNDIIRTTGNTSEYILVAQNATPAVSTGNVSINGVMTLASLKANGGLGSAGQFLTSNGNNVYWSTLTVVDANSSTAGLVNTSTQTFAGNKTFDNNVAIIGYLTVGNNTITLNSTTLVLGNASSNLVMNSSSVTLDGSQIINSSGTANNAANLNGQPASYYTNASNIDSGTLAIGRLDANVLLTTSTTGINASALSTGTVPDGRIAGAYTGVTSLALGANVVANVTTVFVGNSTANASHIATQLSVANSTNTATLTPISLTIGTTVVNTSAVTIGGGTALTTSSTTGINASALSTGTVPLGRLSSANTVANGIVDTTTQTFAGNKSFANDVTITGNLNVLGTTTTVSANNLIVDDSLIQLAANNLTSDILDIGLFGNYNADGGAHEHTGLFRDTSDDTWKLFKGLQDAPTTTVNIAGVGYATATLQSYLLSGALITNTTALTITANSTYNANLTVNTVTAQTFTGNLTGTASNATNLNSQPGSYYTNASNLATGTVAIARLDANVILTTSTTGINASALSTGTVPDGRIAGAYTAVTSLSLGANVVANDTTIFVGNTTTNVSITSTGINISNSTNTVALTPVFLKVGSSSANTVLSANSLTVGDNAIINTSSIFFGNSTANAIHSTTQFVVANSTNTATLTPISLTIGTQIANTTGFYAGANVYANTTTVFVGNSTINVTLTSTPIFNGNSSSGITANSKLTLNTTNGRFVLPVGTNLWAL